MLARARKRKAYHELHKAELTAFLSAHPGAFDVVVSADTLCYFGDLTGFGQAAAQSLRQGGVLVFTVEALDEDAAEEHQIAHHGRYCHKESYVLGTHSFGLEVSSCDTDQLRMESGKPVKGYIVTAVKT